MDLCVLYGATNGPLLSKMVSNIFVQQPKYIDDLKDVAPTVLQVWILLNKQLVLKLVLVAYYSISYYTFPPNNAHCLPPDCFPTQ